MPISLTTTPVPAWNTARSTAVRTPTGTLVGVMRASGPVTSLDIPLLDDGSGTVTVVATMRYMPGGPVGLSAGGPSG